MVYRHGFPLTLLSDQGRNVDGSLIREACRKWGIRKIHSSPYHPEGDGEAERCIQTFKQTMRCLLAEQQMERTAWPNLLQQVTFIHNTQSNSSTGFSPSEVMFGCRLRTQVDTAIPLFVDENYSDDIETYHERASQEIQASIKRSPRI